jgi:CRISPR-associated protein Csd1
VTVFSQLLKLKNHHLSKLERTGRKVYFEKEIGEIVSEIDKFPKHLTLEEQAFFGIGYYHQRQEFFKKNVKEDVATINSEEVHHEQDQ